jgi:hypothetical protein
MVRIVIFLLSVRVGSEDSNFVGVVDKSDSISELVNDFSRSSSHLIGEISV